MQYLPAMTEEGEDWVVTVAEGTSPTEKEALNDATATWRRLQRDFFGPHEKPVYSYTALDPGQGWQWRILRYKQNSTKKYKRR